jgi:5-methylcytosine-specific restriction enzyme subunit McrC
MLYASDLAQFGGAFNCAIDDDIDDLADLIARLLAEAVEKRLRRNLSRGYRYRIASLTRVRGRIDILATEAGCLLSMGQVACGFEELTIDTPRNRLVRSALERLSRMVRSDDIALRCRTLGASLARVGVRGSVPPRSELAQEQLGRNDSEDRTMIALAELAFALAIPTEDIGCTAAVEPERDEVWVRRLFEKAVLGFAKRELEASGWSVRGGRSLAWQVDSSSPGLAEFLPGMVTDIVLESPDKGRRVVIDTKFTNIFVEGRFGEERLKSGYLYQIYAYVRSQEGCDAAWDDARGILLHPAVGASINEYGEIQKHRFTFATIDLTQRPSCIRSELKHVLRRLIE